jgi:hypothetical protein
MQQVRTIADNLYLLPLKNRLLWVAERRRNTSFLRFQNVESHLPPRWSGRNTIAGGEGFMTSDQEVIIFFDRPGLTINSSEIIVKRFMESKVYKLGDVLSYSTKAKRGVSFWIGLFFLVALGFVFLESFSEYNYNISRFTQAWTNLIAAQSKGGWEGLIVLGLIAAFIYSSYNNVVNAERVLTLHTRNQGDVKIFSSKEEGVLSAAMLALDSAKKLQNQRQSAG